MFTPWFSFSIPSFHTLDTILHLVFGLSYGKTQKFPVDIYGVACPITVPRPFLQGCMAMTETAMGSQNLAILATLTHLNWVSASV